MFDLRDFHIAITKDCLAAMPMVTFAGKISLVDTVEKAADALAYLRTQSRVGFDTETRPSFRKGQMNEVALMQVATLDRAFLFRLNNIGIDPVRDFLQDGDILKIGLSLRDDFQMLHRRGEFEPSGFVELQELVKQYGITDASLQKIYGIMFGGRISKSQRLSNWEAAELTQSQQVYAAIDAWACLRIYNTLEAGGFDPDESEFKQPVVEEAPQHLHAAGG
ncbi:MAG: 3'-5' exonuclease [Candidatus Amulumruptor caecigallinarius]|uniref:3'-5' exonuclease domain-containing protein 2 n=1 Tax=Candidatus Amulumruptor caecigallinarius TaxID=2109911 RepID=A0A4Q0U834_9BACT|nr:MAG: 3'-5' exonuclease [Candidatus Amulumruptor caecigallinarius]HJE38756.1 3'-5' exonuclease domain-containing protein 2 [Candidatus Amulumruptor caecigallinarius]